MAIFAFVQMPQARADVMRYAFNTMPDGEVTLSGYFKDDDDKFYDAVMSQLKTGELLDVILTIDVRPSTFWGKVGSMFTQQSTLIHKRLSLDLLTDEVSVHRGETYTSILPQDNLKPSLLSFSHVNVLDAEEVDKKAVYEVDVSLSFHRGGYSRNGMWDKVSNFPRQVMNYIPKTFFNPVLKASLSYKP